MFNEIYNVLKQENLDKIYLVESGSFFITIGSDAEYVSSVLGLAKICFGNNKCKVGFPNNSLSKYMVILEEKHIPYVVYGYMLEDVHNFKVEIEYGSKKYVKLVEYPVPKNNDSNRNITNNKNEIYDLYNKYVNKIMNCLVCPYRRIKIVKEISTCEKRISKLKLELQNIISIKNNTTDITNTIGTNYLTISNSNLSSNLNDITKNIFELAKEKEND